MSAAELEAAADRLDRRVRRDPSSPFANEWGALAEWLRDECATATGVAINAPRSFGLDLDTLIAEDHPLAVAVAQAVLGVNR